MAALLREAGRDLSALPRFPEQLANLAREARRAAGVSVPPPIPGGAAMAPKRPPAEAPASLPKPDGARKSSRRAA